LRGLSDQTGQTAGAEAFMLWEDIVYKAVRDALSVPCSSASSDVDSSSAPLPADAQDMTCECSDWARPLPPAPPAPAPSPAEESSGARRIVDLPFDLVTALLVMLVPDMAGGSDPGGAAGAGSSELGTSTRSSSKQTDSPSGRRMDLSESVFRDRTYRSEGTSDAWQERSCPSEAMTPGAHERGALPPQSLTTAPFALPPAQTPR